MKQTRPRRGKSGIKAMSAPFENDSEFNEAIPKPKTRGRFTLVQFFVVLGMLGLLIALLLPATRSVGPVARRAQCSNSLRQIALALITYEHVHNELPPAYTVDAKGRPLHSWRTLILPYLEYESLYKTIGMRSRPD